MVNVHSAQGGGFATCGDPAFTAVVVQHDRGPHLAHTGLTHICVLVGSLLSQLLYFLGPTFVLYVSVQFATIASVLRQLSLL